MTAILVIEDNDGLRKLIVHILAQEGYRIVEAGDGAHGLEIALNDATIDLVLLDRQLPGLSGAAVRASILATRPELPVLVMSGGGVEADLGPVLTKPFTPSQLCACVAALLDPDHGI